MYIHAYMCTYTHLHTYMCTCMCTHGQTCSHGSSLALGALGLRTHLWGSPDDPPPDRTTPQERVSCVTFTTLHHEHRQLLTTDDAEILAKSSLGVLTLQPRAEDPAPHSLPLLCPHTPHRQRATEPSLPGMAAAGQGGSAWDGHPEGHVHPEAFARSLTEA